jgi:hypothetical protein
LDCRYTPHIGCSPFGGQRGSPGTGRYRYNPTHIGLLTVSIESKFKIMKAPSDMLQGRSQRAKEHAIDPRVRLNDPETV